VLAAAAACSLALTFAGSAQAAGSTFYVSSSGDDNATGASPGTAWRTITRVNSELLRPGDRVLFEGGSTFVGPLELEPG